MFDGDMSYERLMEAMVVVEIPVRWRRGLYGWTEGVCGHVGTL